MSDRQRHGKALVLDEGAARLWLVYNHEDRDALAKFKKAKRADLHLVQPVFDDAAFVAKVEAKLAAAERKQASTTQDFIDIGRMLLERKAIGKQDGSIPHGQWVPWLERNFPTRSYNRLGEYMRVAEAMADPDTKTRLSGFLPQGFDAVLNEVRRLKAAEKRPPKPAPLTTDVTGDDLKIFPGDNRVRMRKLPVKSIHCCITSPPTLAYAHTELSRVYGAVMTQPANTTGKHANDRACLAKSF